MDGSFLRERSVCQGENEVDFIKNDSKTAGRVKKSVAKRQSEYRQRKDIEFTETRYDQAFADIAPGIACLYRCLEDLMTLEPVKVFDFDFGTLGNKRLFGNEEIESTSVYITATWKGAFLARTQRAINHFVSWSKRQLEYWKFADRIRKILQHKN